MEEIGPYEDEKLGFNKVARYHDTPGWQEGGTWFHVMASRGKWKSRPPPYKKAIEVTAQATTASMLAHYHAKNPDATLRVVASGVQICVFPPDVIETINAAAQEHYALLISSNEAFAKIYASQKDFRDRNYPYHRAADYQYDTTMLTLRRKP